MKASTAAKKILKVFEEYGWCQGTAAIDSGGNLRGVFETETVALCIIGAGWKANMGDYGFISLKKHFKNKDIISYNDKPGRTFAQVKRKLRQIAAGDK